MNLKRKRSMRGLYVALVVVWGVAVGDAAEWQWQYPLPQGNTLWEDRIRR